MTCKPTSETDHKIHSKEFTYKFGTHMESSPYMMFERYKRDSVVVLEKDIVNNKQTITVRAGEMNPSKAKKLLTALDCAIKKAEE